MSALIILRLEIDGKIQKFYLYKNPATNICVLLYI